MKVLLMCFDFAVTSEEVFVFRSVLENADEQLRDTDAPCNKKDLQSISGISKPKLPVQAPWC